MEGQGGGKARSRDSAGVPKFPVFVPQLRCSIFTVFLGLALSVVTPQARAIREINNRSTVKRNHRCSVRRSLSLLSLRLSAAFSGFRKFRSPVLPPSTVRTLKAHHYTHYTDLYNVFTVDSRQLTVLRFESPISDN